MRLNEIDYNNALPVDGYGPGFFRVAGAVHKGAVLIELSGVAPWRGYEDVAQLIALKDLIDVLLVGTGAEIAHPPLAFRQALERAGIGIEAMATPAACRTYNVLLGEGRRVAAALLPV